MCIAISNQFGEVALISRSTSQKSCNKGYRNNNDITMQIKLLTFPYQLLFQISFPISGKDQEKQAFEQANEVYQKV